MAAKKPPGRSKPPTPSKAPAASKRGEATSKPEATPRASNAPAKAKDSRGSVRRETIEVDVSWLEDTLPPPDPRAYPTPAFRVGTPRVSAAPTAPGVSLPPIEVQPEWLEDAPSTSHSPRPKTKRLRNPWEPPSLPPPPATAAAGRPRRAIPPPLPREEPREDGQPAPPGASKRPPRR